MEVQKHGIVLQNELLKNVFKLTDEEIAQIKYTSKLDLPREFNRIGDFGGSIKTTKTPNKVDMADCLRVYDSMSSDEPLHMIVMQYKQLGDVKHVSEIIEIDLTSAQELLFGQLTRADIEELDRAVKAVPKGRQQTAAERAKIQELKKRLNNLSGAIHCNPKCDSKDQRRLQCSFNKFQQFLEENPARIVERGTAAAFRGGAISGEVASGPRVFKEKIGARPVTAVLPEEIERKRTILTRLQARLAAPLK